MVRRAPARGVVRRRVGELLFFFPSRPRSFLYDHVCVCVCMSMHVCVCVCVRSTSGCACACATAHSAVRGRVRGTKFVKTKMEKVFFTTGSCVPRPALNTLAFAASLPARTLAFHRTRTCVRSTGHALTLLQSFDRLRLREQKRERGCQKAIQLVFFFFCCAPTPPGRYLEPNAAACVTAHIPTFHQPWRPR
jgi:hypothetical protein